MSDQGNQIGQVNVKVNASGVEETNRKLDEVAAHAKRTAASVNGIGGFSAGPGMSMGGISGPGGDGSSSAVSSGFAQAADVASSAADKAAPKVDSLKNKMKSAVGGLLDARAAVQTLSAATFGWISTIGLVAAPIALVINYLHEKRKAALDASRALGDLTEGWQEYMKSITDPAMDEAERKIGEINKRLEDQVKQIDELGSKAGRSSSEIGADVASARADAQIARDKVRADAAEKQRQGEAKKEIDGYNKLLEETRALEMQAEDERLSDVDRVNAERFRKMGELESRLSRAEDEETQAAIQRQIDAINQIYDYKVQKVQASESTALEAERKANEQRLEAAREQAQQVAQLYVNAANQSRSAIQAAFGGGTSSLLSEMIAKLNIIANSIQRNGGG